ncbi:uncharacterized protein [Typha latifolia]|uniref:uncharacterized protein isoform X1 n=1 Tax=Typha latifolia TaxID=4733 RepID=UPI003C2FAE1F
MGANANSSGNQGGTHMGPPSVQRGGGGNPSNSGDAGAGGNSGPEQALRHNPGLSIEWSAEEQAILEEGLSKYSSEPTLSRYAKIAMQLQDKTVRDVALRCRWITKKENGKRRKEDHNLAKKSKDKKERVGDPSAKPSAHIAGQPNVPPYPLQMLPMDDDDISYEAIGGPTGQLLHHNVQILSQVYTNLTNMQIQENIPLLCQTRDNILAILKEMSDSPEIMKQMPPLPTKINEELANSILPRTMVAMQT